MIFGKLDFLSTLPSWGLHSSRNWLRFARPSLVGASWQEISKHLAVFVTDFVLCVFVGLSFREELASLCSPIPVWGSLARNKNAVAFSLFCFLSALRSELASLRSPIPVWGSLARNQQTPDGVCNRFCFILRRQASFPLV